MLKKYNFKFLNGDDILYDYDGETNFLNESLSFMIEKEKFSFKLGNNFSFIKENEESIFSIEKTNDKIECLIVLKENNYKFDINVSNFLYKFESNKYIIQYKLETEPDILKSIILKIG